MLLLFPTAPWAGCLEVHWDPLRYRAVSHRSQDQSAEDDEGQGEEVDGGILAVKMES